MYFEKKPGHNVDKINIKAGLEALSDCGYSDPKTVMVIEYALNRWSKGEEAAAMRTAIDRNFHGIDLTSFYRVLACSRAAAENEK